MKKTVQNSIFRNWIRKKWIFVRLQIQLFIFQPYMGGRVHGRLCGMFSSKNLWNISSGPLPREKERTVMGYFLKIVSSPCTMQPDVLD